MAFKISIEDEGRHLQMEIRDSTSAEVPISIDPGDEENLLYSKPARKRVKRIAWALYRDFREKTRTYARAILHNIGGTQAQIRQTIERYTHDMNRRKTFTEQVSYIAEKIKENPSQFAKDLLTLEQRAVDLDAQLIGLNILVGKGYDMASGQEHSLESLIQRCMHPFNENLHDNGVYVQFRDMKEAKIQIDFRIFNCGLYHFFDNVKKYVKSDSTVLVTLSDHGDELRFEMESRALERGEEEKIFQEGYCGVNSHSQKGEGLGMYIFWLVLKKMGMSPRVEWDDETRRAVDGKPYQHHRFVIQIPNGLVSF